MLVSTIERPAAGKGFSLIELLVIVAVIAVLAALLLPALKMAKDKGRQASCMSGVRQVAVAVQLYVNDNGDIFVPLRSNSNKNWGGVDAPGIGRDDHWNWKIESYLGNRRVGFCPGDSRRFANWSFVYNLQLGENGLGFTNIDHYFTPTMVKMVQVARPTKCVILYDGMLGEWATSYGMLNGWAAGYFVTWEVAGYSRDLSESSVPYRNMYAPCRGFHFDGSNFTFVDGHTAWYATYPAGWQKQPPNSFRPQTEY